MENRFLLLFLLISITTGLELVWEDNFDTFDYSKWGFDQGGNGWGNKELEYYTNRTENARVENGNLVIEVHREDFLNRSFTSARLTSKFNFKYGVFEARIKLPNMTNGLWPAFWMKGSERPDWPARGEIDIFEAGSASAIHVLSFVVLNKFPTDILHVLVKIFYQKALLLILQLLSILRDHSVLNMLGNVWDRLENVKRTLKSLDPHLLLSFIFHIFGVAFLSFFTPLFIRFLFAYNVVDQTEPLDFVFETCTKEYYGVCSFPEARLSLAEKDIRFSAGSAYWFTLDLELIETDSLLDSRVFLTQVEIKDHEQKTLSTAQRTVNLQYSFFYRWFIRIRNLMFFPLYLIGMLSSSSPTEFHIHFPKPFQSRLNETAAFLVVQIQNRLAQVKWAELHIEANTSYFTYFLHYYPFISFAFLAMISATIFSILMGLYWTKVGFEVYSEASKVEPEDPHFSKPLNIKKKLGYDENYEFDGRKLQEKIRDLRPDDIPECPQLNGVFGWDVKPTGGQKIGFDEN
uniref:Seipin n=1 Tax=Bursaphelenchus xylophilus TaxID=6326 RepID=A0A1I7S8C4_BURXY